MTDTNQNTKSRALQILKSLLTELPAISADIYYQSLRDAEFTEDQAVRLTGASIRKAAAALGWIQKTNLCQNSVKNHSNLQKIWKSNLCDDKKDSAAALAEWARRGFVVPLADLRLWEALQARNVSK